MLDDVLARWRRFNPSYDVTRVPIAPRSFVQRVQQAYAGAEPLPDVIVANTDMLAHLSAPGVLHPLNDGTLPLAQLAPVGVEQCRTEDGRLLALPLAVNPLGVWYRSDILHRAGFPRQPDNVQALIGANWQSFFAVGEAVHTALPDVTWVADAYSDIFEPLTHTSLSLTDAAEFTFAVRQQRLDSAVARESGAWFDRLQRDSVAMVIAGSWMQAILARTTRPDEFPWRVIATPNGCIAGTSVAIAVTEASNNQEVAIKFINDVVFEHEMQLTISDTGNVIPALMQTYSDGRFVRTESFCAGQQVGQLWTTAVTQQTSRALSQTWITSKQQAGEIVQQALNGAMTYPEAIQQLRSL